MYVISKRKPEPQKKEENHDGVGNITKIDSFFNLKIRRGSSLYEFESESEQKIVKKFQEIIDLGGKIKWMINGEVIIVIFSLWMNLNS